MGAWSGLAKKIQKRRPSEVNYARLRAKGKLIRKRLGTNAGNRQDELQIRQVMSREMSEIRETRRRKK